MKEDYKDFSRIYNERIVPITRIIPNNILPPPDIKTKFRDNELYITKRQKKRKKNLNFIRIYNRYTTALWSISLPVPDKAIPVPQLIRVLPTITL